MALAISMIMTKGGASIKVAEVQRELQKHWSDLPLISDLKQEGDSISFNVGDSSVVMVRMPAPIPWSELEGPCETSLLWENAAKQVKQHSHHWVVTVEGELEPLELSTLLTQATAAALAVCSTALGVYWCNAMLIVPKDVFVDFAKEVLPEGPPLHIWVDFRVGQDSETTCAGFTTGMKALGHMEIETEESPEAVGDLRERLMALATYVIDNGPVIGDGDTIGEDDVEAIRIISSESAFGHEDQVMRLVYEQVS